MGIHTTGPWYVHYRPMTRETGNRLILCRMSTEKRQDGVGVGGEGPGNKRQGVTKELIVVLAMLSVLSELIVVYVKLLI